MEGGVRVRLRFEDRHLLSKSQKLEGLKSCWLLLKPQLTTISDLASHLIDTFALQDACPNGLLLFMDGFVLPSFESTCILKDKDIIRIKRKGVALIDDGANDIEESEIVEKQPLLTGVTLLAIEGSEKETQYEHEEPLEEALHLESTSCFHMRSKKKRKHSDDLQSPKRKKAKSATLKKHLMIIDEGIEKDVQTRKNEKIYLKGGLSQKRLNKEDKSSNINSGSNVIIATEVNDEVENIDSTSSDEGDKLLVNGQNNSETSHMLDGTKKFPSRSARRKKAKRKWLRELALGKSQKEELTQNEMLENDMHKNSPDHQPPDQNTDIEDEIVPVEIRPGHIRFEPLGKEQSNRELKDPVETFQWSGTTSKKKGQKWGIEKTSVCRWNGDKDSEENSNEKFNAKGDEVVHAPVDFEKLVPLSGKPKEGDVIAYRLVELSSSWCPELSSFRVGKISTFDPLSQKVMLVPVPKYPVVLDEKKDETIELLSSVSLYNEDGSLEIDFASLVDVRIINHNKANPTTLITNESHEAPVSSQEAGVGKGLNLNAEVAPFPVIENGGQMMVWDDISRALSKKKAQLLQKNHFGTKDSPAKSAWSHRTLKSSALGPTMALLRKQNDLGV